ncbi:MAG TPA: BTAD domain-containing putative transcriptional regulator [Gemmatimonadaceae bacterium]|nr:BTAD domain-containing putative transcriptional regulator [Gemmatimonadaceae bacterium]
MLPQPEVVSRYYLRTLGTLGLSGPGDQQLLGTHGHHRRRLALLSVLAAARDQGRSRDHLLTLFWAEAPESRARHSLDQLLYAVRSSIGDDVFVGVNPVCLNPAVVSTDVGVFMAALEREDPARAITEYRGPFLDGFYLADSAEFERWLEAERTALATRYAAALERLARNAEAAGDSEAAVQWWRKLTDADPLSSRNAASLVRALMRAGDQSAALQFAQRHEAILARELGVSVGPELADLVAALHAESGARSSIALKVPAATITPARARVGDAAEVPDLRDAGRTTLSPPQRSPRGRRLRFALGIPIVLATIAVILTLSRSRSDVTRSQPSGEHSLAVLPFVNVSGAAADLPLVNGLSEELIVVLARVPHVRVIARTSAFAFENSGLNLRRIADSLGVSDVLEGSVERSGQRLHVQVRLIDPGDGVTRWAETYDREFRDVFAVQSDIASGVARALEIQLGAKTLARARRGPTSNVAAYELYLRGNDPSMTRSDSMARAALGYFEQAIVLDHRYAAAYAGLARMQMRVAAGGDTTVSRRERMRLAESAALTAVALDDSLADAHAALSAVRRNNYEFAASEAELKRAVALEPRTARFHEWLVQLYVWMDRPAEALAEARDAVELDPLSPTANAELARALLANGRCDEALAQLTPLRHLQPPLLRASSIATQCYASKGMWPDAIAEATRNAANGGQPAKGVLGFVLARAGRTKEAQQLLQSLLGHSRRRGELAGEIATVYAGLGDKPKAWVWLEQGRDSHTLVLDHLSLALDRLRPDPRVDAFLRQLGLQNR